MLATNAGVRPWLTGLRIIRSVGRASCLDCLAGATRARIITSSWPDTWPQSEVRNHSRPRYPPRRSPTTDTQCGGCPSADHHAAMINQHNAICPAARNTAPHLKRMHSGVLVVIPPDVHPRLDHGQWRLAPPRGCDSRRPAGRGVGQKWSGLTRVTACALENGSSKGPCKIEQPIRWLPFGDAGGDVRRTGPCRQSTSSSSSSSFSPSSWSGIEDVLHVGEPGAEGVAGGLESVTRFSCRQTYGEMSPQQATLRPSPRIHPHLLPTDFKSSSADSSTLLSARSGSAEAPSLWTRDGEPPVGKAHQTSQPHKHSASDPP
jgi:hypothetical protein